MARIKIVTLLAVAALVFATGQMAGAGSVGVQVADHPGGDPRTLVGSGGSSLQKIKVVSDDGWQSFTGAGGPVVGATATMKVKAGTTSLLDIRFSGESSCYNGLEADYGVVTILVDGTEAYPQSGLNDAFDSSMGGNGDWWESGAVERWVKVGSGNHTVTVTARVFGTATFVIDDWTLAVEQMKST